MNLHVSITYFQRWSTFCRLVFFFFPYICCCFLDYFNPGHHIISPINILVSKSQIRTFPFSYNHNTIIAPPNYSFISSNTGSVINFPWSPPKCPFAIGVFESRCNHPTLHLGDVSHLFRTVSHSSPGYFWVEWSRSCCFYHGGVIQHVPLSLTFPLPWELEWGVGFHSGLILWKESFLGIALLLSRLSGDPIFNDVNCSVDSGGVSLVTSWHRSPSVFAAIVSTAEVPVGQQNGDVSPAILVCVR